jgi:hypothetical protein
VSSKRRGASNLAPPTALQRIRNVRLTGLA